MNKYNNAIKIITERFSKDSIIAIATTDGKCLYNRMVDAYYENGAFYVVTYTLSSKIKHIETNSKVAICAIDWFTGHGIGENLGWVLDESNKEIMIKLREAFASWYTGGHVDENDPNTCVLRIRLTNGILIDHDRKYDEWRYELDFVNQTI